MVQAVILAGGKGKRIGTETVQNYEALLEIGGRPMLSFVVAALQKSRYIEKIFIAGPCEKLQMFAGKQIQLLEGGKHLLETMQKVYDRIGEVKRVVVLTTDIPFLTTAALDDFLAQCEGKTGDFFYPVIEKRDVQQTYPEAQRTYVKLTDGVFTGGNVVVMNMEILPRCKTFALQVMQNRKKPWRIISLLGWRILLRFLFQRLSTENICTYISEKLNMQGVVIFSKYPELGMDIDKKSDYKIAKNYLSINE